jgi:hypothetical protein
VLTSSGRVTFSLIGAAIICFFAVVVLSMLQADVEQPEPPAPQMPAGFVGYCTTYGHRIYVDVDTRQFDAVEDAYCAAKVDQ